MLVQIDLNELAAAVTQKIRDEIQALKVVDFGEVVSTQQIVGKGWKATVKLAGATSPTVFLDCLTSYTPTASDWVLLVYPKNAAPVIVGKCPV